MVLSMMGGAVGEVAASEDDGRVTSEMRQEWGGEMELVTLSYLYDGLGGYEQANMLSTSPSLSDDGRYVAFTSLASNLVADDTNNKQDVFVRDRELEINRGITIGGNGHSTGIKISGDGKRMVFVSSASNLVSNDTNNVDDVFWYEYDEYTGTEWTGLISKGKDADGNIVSANNTSRIGGISGNGERIVFTCTN